MTVSKGLVFWYDNVGAVDKRVNIIKKGEREIRSHLIAGARPWVVVASNTGATGGNVCSIVPITSNENGECPERVQFKLKGRVQTVLLDQVQTVDAIALTDFQYVLDQEIMDKIDEGLVRHFSLERCGEGQRERELEEKLLAKTKENEALIGAVERLQAADFGTEERKYREQVIELEKALLEKSREVAALTESNKAKDTEIEKLKKTVQETPVDISSAVEKYNKKFAQVIGLGMIDGGAEKAKKEESLLEEEDPENKKSGNISTRKWTKVQALDFLKECNELGNNKMAEKYGFSSGDTVYQTKRRLKKRFNI